MIRCTFFIHLDFTYYNDVIIDKTEQMIIIQSLQLSLLNKICITFLYSSRSIFFYCFSKIILYFCQLINYSLNNLLALGSRYQSRMSKKNNQKTQIVVQVEEKQIESSMLLENKLNNLQHDILNYLKRPKQRSNGSDTLSISNNSNEEQLMEQVKELQKELQQYQDREISYEKQIKQKDDELKKYKIQNSQQKNKINFYLEKITRLEKQIQKLSNNIDLLVSRQKCANLQEELRKNNKQLDRLKKIKKEHLQLKQKKKLLEQQKENVTNQNINLQQSNEFLNELQNKLKRQIIQLKNKNDLIVKNLQRKISKQQKQSNQKILSLKLTLKQNQYKVIKTHQLLAEKQHKIKQLQILQKNFSQSKIQIQKYKKQVSEGSKKQQRLNKSVNNLQGMNHIIQKEIEIMRRQKFKDYEIEIIQKQDKIKRFEDLISKNEANLFKAERNLEKLRDEEKIFKAQIIYKEQQITILSNQMKTKDKKFNQQNYQLKNQIERKNGALKQFEQQYESVKSQFSNQKQKLKFYVNSEKQKSIQISSLSQKYNIALRQKNQINSEVALLKSRLQFLEKQKLNDQKQIKYGYSMKLKSISQQMMNLNTSLTFYHNENEQLKQLNKEYESYCHNSEAKIGQIEGLLRQRESIIRVLQKDSLIKNQQVRQMNQLLEKNAEQIKKGSDSSISMDKQFTVLKYQNKKLSEKLCQLEICNQNLRRQCDELKQDQLKFQKLQINNQNTQQKLQYNLQKNQEIIKQNVQTKARFSDYKDLYKYSQRQVEEIKESLFHQNQRSLAQMKQQFTILTVHNMKLCQQKIKKYKMAYVNAKSEIQDLKIQMQKQEGRVVNLTKSLQKAKDLNNNVVKEVSLKEQALSLEATRIQELKNKTIFLIKENNHYKQQLGIIEAKLCSVQTNYKNAQQQIKNARMIALQLNLKLNKVEQQSKGKFQNFKQNSERSISQYQSDYQNRENLLYSKIQMMKKQNFDLNKQKEQLQEHNHIYRQAINQFNQTHNKRSTQIENMKNSLLHKQKQKKTLLENNQFLTSKLTQQISKTNKIKNQQKEFQKYLTQKIIAVDNQNQGQVSTLKDICKKQRITQKKINQKKTSDCSLFFVGSKIKNTIQESIIHDLTQI